MRNSGPLVWVDDEYDREFASDGFSRFGSYLRRAAHMFDPDDSAEQAAVSLWQVARSPSMSPPYLYVRPDLSIELEYDSRHDDLLIRATVPVRRKEGARLSTWADWVAAPVPWQGVPWQGEDEVLWELIEPDPGDWRAVLFSAQLLATASLAEAGMSIVEGQPDVSDAKRILGSVCGAVDEQISPMLSALFW